MILRKLKLENFRQYKGKQEVEFAYENGNITIFFGENGKGKTGIYRAVMFCLYGTTRIEQDNPKDEIRLVNIDLVNESKSVAQARVTMTIEHDGKVYEITRTCKERQTTRSVDQRIQKATIRQRDEQGNWSPEIIEDEVKITQIINSILHEGIKDFFLFDAERIDSLAKTDRESRLILKKGIFKVIQMTSVEEGNNIVNTILKAERDILKSQIASEAVVKKEEEIKHFEQKKVAQEQVLDEYEANLVACNDEIEKLTDQLVEDDRIKAFQERIQAKKGELKRILEYLADVKKEALKPVFQAAPYLLAKDTMVNMTNYLDQVIAQQKNIVPIEVLDISLNKGICACCNNDLTVHIENKQHIVSLKENYSRSELTLLISSMKNTYANRMMNIDEDFSDLKDYAKKIGTLMDQRNTIRKEIEYLQEQIGITASDIQNLVDIQKLLNEAEKNAKNIQVQIEVTNREIEDITKQLKTKQVEYNRLLDSQISLEFDKKVIKILEDLKENMTKIESTFSDTMRQKLQETATRIFKEIIDPKDQDLLKEIRINEQFSFEFIGWDNSEITQDISQGQRQMVALSIITALAKIATGNSFKIRFPLFMDTPFGRISGLNRDQLISNIPNLTSQWVLLLTDTELSGTEQKAFRSTGKLGAWYRLNQIKPGHTVIEKVELTDDLATRGVKQ